MSIFVRICLLTITLTYSYYSISTSQDTISTSSQPSEITSEKHYTRIPNKDFDELLENKVVSKINDKFTFWITVIGIFVTAIGGLAAYAFNNKIKQMVLELTKSHAEKQFEKVNNYLQNAQKYIYKSDFETLKEKFNRNPKSEINLHEAQKLLNQIHELKNPDLLSDIIDLLGVMYYQHLNPKEIDKMIVQYEKECEIKETTYMNAAILYSDLYELDGAPWYKSQCLKYCELASQKIPHYGEPKGIMILIYAIDFVRSSDEKEKQKALQNTKSSISEILKGSSSYTAFNTVTRIKKDLLNNIFGQYLLKLEAALPEEFKKLYEEALSYETRSQKLPDAQSK